MNSRLEPLEIKACNNIIDFGQNHYIKSANAQKIVMAIEVKIIQW